MLDDLVEYGNSVYEMAYLYKEDLDMAKKHGTSWYRSKEKKGGDNPFASYMLNKKMDIGGGVQQSYDEVPAGINQFYIYFSKLHFDIPGWIGGR